ncbi:MAG: hypothetical protein K2H72_04235, partial [Muribaculaceae bacterium]|nr:hypothetical protein [Muribaculaceae bacterium]
MKKLISLIMIVVLISGLSSCRNDNDPLADGNYRLHREKIKNEMKKVSLNFSGDFISESEEPLLRAEDVHIYKAVNVYAKDDKEGSDYQIYARGLFVDQENVEINLWTGYKYRFVATVLIDDRDKVALNNGKYSNPFQYQQVGTSSKSDLDPKNINSFVYSQNEINSGSPATYHMQLDSGKTYVDVSGDGGIISTYFMAYPRLKRFYGTCEDFSPIETNPTVEIEMEYKCFGLEIIAESLPFGTITVKDVSDSDWTNCLLFPKGLVLHSTAEGETPDSYEGLFSMNSMNNESSNITLKFSWNKG